MEVKEFQDLLGTELKAFKESLQFVNPTEFEQKFNDFKTEMLDKLDSKDSQEAITKLTAAFDEFKNESKIEKETEVKSFKDAIVGLFEEKGIKTVSDIVKLSGQELEMKADNPLINSSYTGNYSRTQEVAPVRFPSERETAFINKGIKVGVVDKGKNIILWTVGSFTDHVAYIDELSDATAGVDGSTTVATEKTRKLSKIVAREVISKDSLEDIPQIAERMQMKLLEKMELWLDQKIFDGQGGPAADTQIYGLTSPTSLQVTAFDDTAVKVKNAHVGDLADACALQAKKNRHSANTVWMSDTLAYKLQHTKDANNNYIINRLVDGSLIMNGRKVITSEDLFGGDTEKMLVGDPAKIQFWIKRNLTGEFERIAKSDSYNFYVYARQQVLVEDEDIKGLIYVADVEAALAAITEPVA